jgi:hypothetical protein
MEKTLNDTIEGFFRGIVFIFFGSIAAFGYLVIKPLSAPVLLVSRIYRKDREQVRPYVFLFLAITSAFLLPVLLGAGASKNDPFAYKYYENGQDMSERSFVGKIFDYSVENFQERGLLPITVAAVVGVSIFHIAIRFFARLSFVTRFRRSLVADSVFLLSGAQIILALCAWLLISRISFAESVSPADWINSLLTTFKEALAPAGRMNARWVYVLQAFAVTWILLLPWPTALRLARKSRWGSFKARQRKLPIRTLFLAIGFTLYIDLVFWLVCTSAGFLYKKFSPLETLPYQIKSMECKIDQDGAAEKLVARILVTVTGKDAWEFNKDDFRFFLGASRTTNDPPGRKIKYPLFNPNRISLLVGNADTLEPDDSSRSTLVEPGRWKVLKVTAPLDAKIIEFLKAHPDEVRCTISDRNDNPVGYIAPLDL